MSKPDKSRRSAIHVVGHPSAPIGMGEHARSVFRALEAAGVDPLLVDIYGPAANNDKQLISTYADKLSHTLGSGVNIFCINADEVEQAFGVLKSRNLKMPGSVNVIYPAWELSGYPAVWGAILDEFDEVWAPSAFIAEAVIPSTRTPVRHMPLACEIGTRGLYSRRHFGIPDGAYCFLFSFDFLSYIERKNPYAVLDAFQQAVELRPDADIRLVLKLNNTGRRPEAYQAFLKHYSAYRDRVVVIDRSLTDLEMKALMWLSDCFVSLHRSEGFGRGMSEAMMLGKPTIATAYSGNMDFCTPDTAFLVPHELVPLEPGDYPFWEDQVWADPDVEAASAHMIALIDDPALGWRRGATARAHISANFSFIARGLDYMSRCNELSRRRE